GTFQVPSTVQAVLAARLDRLRPEDKPVLQAAAGIRPEVPGGLLQTGTEQSDEALRQGLARLPAAHGLYGARLHPHQAYAFKHALTVEVAYGSILTERRQAIHDRVGRAIEAWHGDRVDEHLAALAHHYRRAGNVERALHYLKLSAAQAAARAAVLEAQ